MIAETRKKLSSAKIVSRCKISLTSLDKDLSDTAQNSFSGVYNGH